MADILHEEIFSSLNFRVQSCPRVCVCVCVVGGGGGGGAVATPSPTPLVLLVVVQLKISLPPLSRPFYNAIATLFC